MKTRSKIALASILVGLVASATAISTVAWFNGSSALIISDFKVSLVDQKLLVSTDNEHFYDKLYMEDESTIESEENSNVGQYLPDVSPFRPVSSMFKSTWYNPDAPDDEKVFNPIFRRGVSGSRPLTKDQYTSASDFGIANDGFLSQELYFKAQVGGAVTVDAEKTFVIADEEKNLQTARELVDVNYNHEAYDHLQTIEEKVALVKEGLDKVAKSARFSILVLNDTAATENALSDYAYTIIDPYKEESGDTYLGGVLDNNLDGFFDSYQGKEALFGEINGAPKYGNGNGSSEPKVTLSCFDAVHKNGTTQLDIESMKANNQIAIEDSKSLKEAEETIRIGLNAAMKPDENGRIVSSTKKIVLSFYLEGWDLDNTNLSMYANFKVNFSFKFASNAHVDQ